MRSIQTKIVLIFCLLILVAMQFIGTYLLRALEASFLEDERAKRTTEAQLLAAEVSSLLHASTQGNGGGAGGGQGATGTGRDSGDAGGSASEATARIQELLREFNQGRYVHMMVLDGDGTVIAASDPGLVGQRALQEAEVLAVLEETHVRTYQRRDPDSGTRRLGAAVPVLSQEGRALGVALVEGDLSVVEQTLVEIRGILFTATAVAVGLAVLLAWVTARTLTGPIQAVTRRAAEMAAGEFDRRIEVRSQDELGRLAAMFNYLAGRLKDTLDEISTEKRKVEAILAHMTDGVAAFDQAGRFILMNPAAQRMLGFEGRPVEAWLGRTIAELWPDWDVDETLRAVLQGKAASADAVVLRLGDRTLRTYFAAIEGSGSPHDSESEGHPAAAGAVWVLHDVTELERLEEMRREFVANVSHELRTPLTTIQSYSETLLTGEGIDPDIQRHFLRVIHDETERMARLVRDLLDLSQLEYQRATWDREFCQLSEIARQALTKLQAEIQEKALDVTIEREGPDVEPLVYVDPDRFQQVLLNILSNAIEFTPAGGAIRVRIVPEAGAVRVAVEDTGVGIPPEDAPRIFDRFFRVDKARTRKRKLGGTGLGLSIARQIVEGHGGRIGVESQLGRGTTVWFTVPLEPVETAG